MKKDNRNISYFHTYHPVGHDLFEKNPEGYILDVKDGLDIGINHFFNEIVEDINTLIGDNPNGYAFCSMPSSDSQHTVNGMRVLTSKLASSLNCIDATSCIVRHTTKGKSHDGDRSYQSHINTLHIINTHLLKNKHIIIFDDVVTSGATLLAGRDLIENHQIQSVTCIALAKSYGWD